MKVLCKSTCDLFFLLKNCVVKLGLKKRVTGGWLFSACSLKYRQKAPSTAGDTVLTSSCKFSFDRKVMVFVLQFKTLITTWKGKIFIHGTPLTLLVIFRKKCALKKGFSLFSFIKDFSVQRNLVAYGKTLIYG